MDCAKDNTQISIDAKIADSKNPTILRLPNIAENLTESRNDNPFVFFGGTFACRGSSFCSLCLNLLLDCSISVISSLLQMERRLSSSSRLNLFNIGMMTLLSLTSTAFSYFSLITKSLMILPSDNSMILSAYSRTGGLFQK